jgi:hypothetical protein
MSKGSRIRPVGGIASQFKKGNDASKDYRFKKGQSGNPGGRPKVAGHIRELAQQHGEDAIKVLVAEMTNPESTAPARIAAAIALLDRGYGKPQQTVELHNFNHETEMTEAELERIARGDAADGSERAAEASPSTH